MGKHRIEVVEAEVGHVYHIAQHMRAGDREEVWLAHGSSPYEALRRGFLESETCRTALVDGEPVVMWGVVERSLLHRTGIVWMLSTDKISEIDVNRRELKIIWRELMSMISGYQKVENYVHAKNETSLRLLQFLGFDIADPEEAGLFNEPFCHFEMRIH